jgi:uncharacterized membrane protein YdbT with pleckstrin-like domain
LVKTVANGSIDMFPRTNYFNKENDLVLAVVKVVIVSHLISLVTQFEKYFTTDWDIEKNDCIRQRFSVPSEKKTPTLN